MPRVRKQGNFQEISEFDKIREVSLREAELSFREMVKKEHRSVNTVLVYCRVWNQEGRRLRARGSGRVSRMTSLQDIRLRFWLYETSSRPQGHNGLQNMADQLQCELSIGGSDVWDLRHTLPHVVLPLRHQSDSLVWCRERLSWDLEWKNVILSDKSRFCLGMHYGRASVIKDEILNFLWNSMRITLSE